MKNEWKAKRNRMEHKSVPFAIIVQFIINDKIFVVLAASEAIRAKNSNNNNIIIIKVWERACRTIELDNFIIKRATE